MRLFSLCTFVLKRFETIIWPSIRFDKSLQNFKRLLDIFRTAKRKKTFQRKVLILPVKESFERLSCLEFIFEKCKSREAGLKHKLKVWAWRLRIFRDTLIFVFVKENRCLCIYFTELYFFYSLLVAALLQLKSLCRLFSVVQWTSLVQQRGILSAHVQYK